MAVYLISFFHIPSGVCKPRYPRSVFLIFPFSLTKKNVGDHLIFSSLLSFSHCVPTLMLPFSSMRTFGVSHSATMSWVIGFSLRDFLISLQLFRSEERRVGKECRSR